MITTCLLYLMLLLDTLYAKDCKTLRKRKLPGKHLQEQGYYASEVLAVLRTLPFHYYPSHDDLLAFSTRYLGDKAYRQKRIRKVPPKALYILKHYMLRHFIECLVLQKWEPEQIFQILQKNNQLPAGFDLKDIQAYLAWFWDPGSMSIAEQDLFFSQLQENRHYHLHCAIYFQVIDEPRVLSNLGLELDAENNLMLIQRMITQLLQNMNRYFVSDNVKKISMLSQSLSSLASAYGKLGGVDESKRESLADYVQLISDDSEDFLTWEDIEEENRRARAEREAKRNKQLPNIEII